jgi:hypothetical protein
MTNRGLHDDLDRELQAALRVQPSVEFLARVRLRLAGEPEPTRALPLWRIVTLGTSVAAASLAVAVVRDLPNHPPNPPIAASADVSLPGGSAAAFPARERPGSPVLSIASVTPKRSDRPKDLWPAAADVIVSSAEAEALRRLTIAVREERFRVVLDEPPAGAVLIEPSSPDEIVIAPLDVERIDTVGE